MTEIYKALALLVASLCQYIAAHPGGTLVFVIFGMLGWWIFSAVTSALPAPEEIWPNGDGRNYQLYKFGYKFAHALSGSIGRFISWARFKWGLNGKKDEPQA